MLSLPVRRGRRRADLGIAHSRPFESRNDATLFTPTNERHLCSPNSGSIDCSKPPCHARRTPALSTAQSRRVIQTVSPRSTSTVRRPLS